MTTFLRPSSETERENAAIAIADWLLQVVKLKKADEHAALYNLMYASLKNPSDNAAQDFHSLFQLLLGQHEVIFSFLQQAKEEREVVLTVKEDVHGGEGKEGKEKEVHKTYSDVIREVDDFFTALMTMSLSMGEDVRDKAVGDMVHVLSSKNNFPDLRIRLMMTLYNMFPPNYKFRFAICMRIVEYCAENQKFDVIAPYMQFVEVWMDDWRIDVENRRKLFLLVATQLKRLSRGQESYRFLKRHVEEYQGASAETLRSVAVSAVELAEETIKRPDIVYIDTVLRLDAIKNLVGTDEGKIVELLEVFVSGVPADLETFFSANAQYCQARGFDHTQCLRKIRLLHLASHAASSTNGQLSLTAVAKSLSMSEAELEELVVLAIGENLLDAKIDQINRVVLIRSAVQREFDKVHWERFQGKLAQWKENIKSLIDILNKDAIIKC